MISVIARYLDGTFPPYTNVHSYTQCMVIYAHIVDMFRKERLSTSRIELGLSIIASHHLSMLRPETILN